MYKIILVYVIGKIISNRPWIFAFGCKVKHFTDDDYAADVEKSIRKKFSKTIWGRFTKAVIEYELVKPNDKIAVCISGGKDSMLMAKLFQELKRQTDLGV